MKDLLILTEAEDKLAEVQNFVKWWESKRLWFNIAIGLAGIIPLLINNRLDILFSFEIIPIIFYALAINICYCAGWGLGIIIWNYTGKINPILLKAQWLLFILGTLFSALITFSGSQFTLEFI